MEWEKKRFQSDVNDLRQALRQKKDDTIDGKIPAEGGSVKTNGVPATKTTTVGSPPTFE